MPYLFQSFCRQLLSILYLLFLPPSYFYLSLFFRTSSESLCAELNPVSRLGSVCFEDDLSEE